VAAGMHCGEGEGLETCWMGVLVSLWEGKGGLTFVLERGLGVVGWVVLLGVHFEGVLVGIDKGVNSRFVASSTALFKLPSTF
jgi:hypothetical protein